jgi:hypothetical protein
MAFGITSAEQGSGDTVNMAETLYYVHGTAAFLFPSLLGTRLY